MEHLVCMPLGLWEQFFQTAAMEFKLLTNGDLMMAFGERVFFYERLHSDIFCVIKNVAA